MSETKKHPFHLHMYRGPLFDSIRELIFGLEDGMVSTLGVIVGIAAGTGQRSVVILSGFVVIAVEALSMAAGSYLSNKSDQELKEKLLQEQREDIEERPEQEQKQAEQILGEKGYTIDEQVIIMQRLRKSRKRLFSFLAHHDLDMGVVKPPFKTILLSAIVMWGAYLIGGTIALSAFFFIPMMYASVIAVFFVASALFLLGVLKGAFLGISWLRSGLEMMLVSLVAAGVGQFVGWFIGKVIL